MSDSFVFDIFPATFSEFVAVKDRGNGGFALSWDPAFPVLKDADGDGLRSTAEGGNDPNDNAADSDGDSLRDFYARPRRKRPELALHAGR